MPGGSKKGGGLKTVMYKKSSPMYQMKGHELPGIKQRVKQIVDFGKDIVLGPAYNLYKASENIKKVKLDKFESDRDTAKKSKGLSKSSKGKASRIGVHIKETGNAGNKLSKSGKSTWEFKKGIEKKKEKTTVQPVRGEVGLKKLRPFTESGVPRKRKSGYHGIPWENN